MSRKHKQVRGDRKWVRGCGLLHSRLGERCLLCVRPTSDGRAMPAHSAAGWAEQGRYESLKAALAAGGMREAWPICSCSGRWAGYQACRRRRPAADTDEVPLLLGRVPVLVVVLVPEEEVAAQEARVLP